jgi:hypothetical protein
MSNLIRRLRIGLTILLGLLLLLDAEIAHVIRQHGFPFKRITTEDAGAGAIRVLHEPVPFTQFDGIVLGLFVALQIALCYLVRRSWKATGAR